MSSTTPPVVLKAPFRKASKDDCYGIAELVRMSSGGLADYLWSASGGTDLNLLEIGEQHLAREESGLSYKNCIVAEIDGEVAGLMLSFPEIGESVDYFPATPSAAAKGEVDVLAPYRALHAPDCYHIAEMALLPPYQGQGLGTRMYEIARALARAHGCAELSLMVFEQNVGALRLYERLGFKEIDRRPVVPHDLVRYTGDVLLMTAPVAVGAAGR